MWIILVTICALLIISLGVFVALYVEKKHDENSLLRVVEQNGIYYIQKHEMQCDDYGKYHSVWNYEGTLDESGYQRYSFPSYNEARDFAEKLMGMYHHDRTQSMREYFEGKRDDFQIIKYFE